MADDASRSAPGNAAPPLRPADVVPEARPGDVPETRHDAQPDVRAQDVNPRNDLRASHDGSPAARAAPVVLGMAAPPPASPSTYRRRSLAIR